MNEPQTRAFPFESHAHVTCNEWTIYSIYRRFETAPGQAENDPLWFILGPYNKSQVLSLKG